MTPDRPSIEELLDELQMKTTAWTRAVLNPYTNAEIEAARERVVAAREALLSRFLEQQKELLTPEEAQAVLSLPVWKSLVPQTAANFTALEKIRRRSIQPGGTPQNG